jgi:hypothetical protein
MSVNPLQQYFRRPVLYFSLPSQGRYYDNNIVNIPPNGQLAVYPMTAIDEITVRTPDALYNGTAMVDLIKSCIPAISDPWSINSIDIDSITIAIKIASTGEEMDFDSTCPNCQEDARYGLNLLNLLNQQKDIDYDQELNLGDLKVKFKPLKYSEMNNINITQYEIRKLLVTLENFEDNEEQKKLINENLMKMNEAITDMLVCTIDYIETPETRVYDRQHIKEFLFNCDKNVNKLIKDSSLKLREENSLKPVHIKCIHCSHEYDQPIIINVVDFFG